MSQYFEYSQKIRKEIEGNKIIMNKIEDYIHGKENLEFIGSGTINSHYRVGELESGLWVAIRDLKFENHLKKARNLLSIPESYALTAEKYFLEGKKVSKFSIGAFSSDNIILLIEDLTNGGKRKIKHDQSEIFGFYQDNNEEVYLDLEQSFPFYEKFLYMNKENSIIF